MRRILEIWASGQGVISVHCFQNTVPAEAYTREGCLVEALGKQGWAGGNGAAPVPCCSSWHRFLHHSDSLHPSLPPCAGAGRTQRGDAAHPGAHGDFGVPGCQHRVWTRSPKPPSAAGKKTAWGGGLPPSLWVLMGSRGPGLRVLTLSPAGLQTITNQRKGNCYGVAASWPADRRRRLGVHMLHRAMRIFLAEGERQLWPADIQGGR